MFPEIFKRDTTLIEVERDVEASTIRKVHSRQKALELSIKEGSFSTVSASIGNSYITPFALALNSSTFQIGLLSSLSSLINPLSQLFGSKLLRENSRKKIITTFVLLQSLIWIPILSLSYLFINNMFLKELPYILIALYIFMISLGGIAYPAWFSWMGDIVPEKDRGKYFGLKTKIIGFIGLFASITSAFLLDIFKTKGLALIGFSILFSLAFVFRFIALIIFKKTYCPKFKQNKLSNLSFISFISRKNNYTKFILFTSLFYFSLMIASPFFAVYMLESLKFSYTTFIIVAMSASVFYLILSPVVGKFADKFGNLKLFYLSTILFAIYPLFWIFLKSPILLIIFPQLIGGIANAFFIIAFTKFTYDSLSKQEMAQGISYTNILMGIGMFLGALFGGFIIKYAPLFFSLNTFTLIFVISALLRLILPLPILMKLKDIKKVEKLPPIHLELAHPIKTIQSEISWLRQITKS